METPPVESITVCSTGWHTIDVPAISNFPDDIVIGERVRDDSENCYVRNICFQTHGTAWREFYALSQHIMGDCIPDECEYCNEQEEE